MYVEVKDFSSSLLAPFIGFSYRFFCSFFPHSSSRPPDDTPSFSPGPEPQQAQALHRPPDRPLPWPGPQYPQPTHTTLSLSPQWPRRLGGGAPEDECRTGSRGTPSHSLLFISTFVITHGWHKLEECCCCKLV